MTVAGGLLVGCFETDTRESTTFVEIEGVWSMGMGLGAGAVLLGLLHPSDQTV